MYGSRMEADFGTSGVTTRPGEIEPKGSACVSKGSLWLRQQEIVTAVAVKVGHKMRYRRASRESAAGQDMPTAAYGSSTNARSQGLVGIVPSRSKAAARYMVTTTLSPSNAARNLRAETGARLARVRAGPGRD